MEQHKDCLALTGRQDINGRGYGSVTLTASESDAEPVRGEVVVGNLFVTIQAADGRVLERSLPVGLRPKPEARKREPRQSVTREIRFCAPDDIDLDEIKGVIGEEEIGSFGSSFLGRYREALAVADGECAYWGEKTETSGVSKLVVEINAAHSRFKKLLESISTAEERIRVLD